MALMVLQSLEHWEKALWSWEHRGHPLDPDPCGSLDATVLVLICLSWTVRCGGVSAETVPKCQAAFFLSCHRPEHRKRTGPYSSQDPAASQTVHHLEGSSPNISQVGLPGSSPFNSFFLLLLPFWNFLCIIPLPDH